MAGNLTDFFSAIEECERRYPVSRWSIDGVPAWPFVRIEGRQELARDTASKNRHRPLASRILNLARFAAAPLLDVLRNFMDWKHEELLLKPVDALFLGDGVSHDCIKGAWRDRYCAPLIAALEANGGTALLMQPRTQRLPRERDTYSVQWIAAWGHLLSRLKPASQVNLPDYDNVKAVFQSKGFDLRVLDLPVLRRWGVKVAAMARMFGPVLDRTKPQIGFVVGYYWDVGFAFDLACRRRSILTVDIQHGSQDGRHEAYNFWAAMPAVGYSILPSIFWTWTEEDANGINSWAQNLTAPWHRAVWGGHPQFAAWLDENHLETLEFDARIASIRQRGNGTFDILVALQDLDGYGGVWDRLAETVMSSPPTWRWWLRRHPWAAYNRGVGIKNLIALKRPNIIIEEAGTLPMPALLRNVDAVLSLMSSTAVEAAFFGHRPIFLTQDARMQFSAIFKTNRADIITDKQALIEHLTALEQGHGRVQRRPHRSNLRDTVRDLFVSAKGYRN
ncbi:MAG: hypothetical protein RL274_521 [Pseudomonadota bacterium]|jgi:hypothetical protein